MRAIIDLGFFEILGSVAVLFFMFDWLWFLWDGFWFFADGFSLLFFALVEGFNVGADVIEVGFGLPCRLGCGIALPFDEVPRSFISWELPSLFIFFFKMDSNS
jgi:hypothetical protein